MADDPPVVEVHYFQHRAHATPLQIEFWLKELRTPILLSDVAAGHTSITDRLAKHRPLLAQARSGGAEKLEALLLQEELAEKQKDRLYWEPLKKQLEAFRRAVLQGDPGPSFFPDTKSD